MVTACLSLAHGRHKVIPTQGYYMPLIERLEAQTVEFECRDDVSCMAHVLGSWVL